MLLRSLKLSMLAGKQTVTNTCPFLCQHVNFFDTLISNKCFVTVGLKHIY